MTPIQDAITIAFDRYWQDRRKEATMRSWLKEFIKLFPELSHVEDISSQHLKTYVALLRDADNAPATIYSKVCMVSRILEAANIPQHKRPRLPYPHVPRQLKWWLNPEQEARALKWLTQQDTATYRDLHDYIRWTVLTGLRVEETLRLARYHFHGLSSGAPMIDVPGTKTATSQAGLPITMEAARIAMQRFEASGCLTEPFAHTRLFPLSYKTLWTAWDDCRKALGLADIPTATLKAIRRSFVRLRAGKGTPLPILQRMLRHRDPNTTMGYLRLTGGDFTTEEMRQWL